MNSEKTSVATTAGKPLSQSNMTGVDVNVNGRVLLDGARLYRFIKSNAGVEDQLLTLTLESGLLNAQGVCYNK